MNNSLIQAVVWVARLVWACYLMTHVKHLHLSEHTEDLITILYMVLILWKLALTSPAIEHDDKREVRLKRLNWICLSILVVACLTHFLQVTNLNDSAAIQANLADCLITVLVFIAGEVMFDELLLARVKRRPFTWRSFRRQFAKSFGINLTKKATTKAKKQRAQRNSVKLSQTLAVNESGKLLDATNSPTLTDITKKKSSDDDLSQESSNLSNTPVG